MADHYEKAKAHEVERNAKLEQMKQDNFQASVAEAGK